MLKEACDLSVIITTHDSAKNRFFRELNLNDNSLEPHLASQKEVKRALAKLNKIDEGNMLDCVLRMPEQIIIAADAAREFNEGDIPLDRSRINLVGLGGSAIAGELLLDMLAPRRLISIHRGLKPPRNKRGLIVSSYSGETREILEIAPLVTGGLRTVVFVSSGGKLVEIAKNCDVPVWRVPTGYQPRAAIGWFISLVLDLMERWRIVLNEQSKLIKAAKRLKASIERDEISKHVLIRAALPIAEKLHDKYTVIMHTHSCGGAARRLAGQINENAKLPAFSLFVPEALHNSIEGIAGGDPERWALIFMSDQNDPPLLREAILSAMDYLSGLGFNCFPFPAAGDDQFELTLSRLLLSDMVSLFLSALTGKDPTPLKVITELKRQIESE